ncbi:MAG: hypothetical protein AB1768_14210 [Pseudomonadota bacterium]
MRRWHQSLRFRMVFAASMVLIVMLALLVANGIRLMDATLAACDAEFMRQAGADLLW